VTFAPASERPTSILPLAVTEMTVPEIPSHNWLSIIGSPHSPSKLNCRGLPGWHKAGSAANSTEARIKGMEWRMRNCERPVTAILAEFSQIKQDRSAGIMRFGDTLCGSDRIT